MPRLLCRADESERVKRSREAKQRICDPEGIGEVLLRSADREVRRYVSLQLRLAAAERRDRGERDQLTVLDRNVFARVVVAEAPGGQVIDDEALFAFGCGLVHLQNVITAEDSALGVETFLEPVLIIHRGALCLNLDARVTERGKGLAERGFRAARPT